LKTQFLKSAYYNYNESSLNSLIDYLKSIGGKPLRLIIKRENIFKVFKIKNSEEFYRCHVQSASDYLSIFKSELIKERIRIVIADLIPFVNFLDSNEDTSFIAMNSNILPSFIHFFITKNLFYEHKIMEQHKNPNHLDLLVIYSMRLCLESRIKGFLGIDFAKVNGKDIGLSIFIDIAKGLKHIEYSNKINWSEIIKLNAWINNFIHRTYRPYPWLIHQAVEILKTLFDRSDVNNSHIQVSSFYGSTYVKDENKLKEEIQTNLNKKYKTKPEINWLYKREIVKRP